MNILGIETSCDETAAAVVRNGSELLSNVIVSQIDIHREFGGVVPEVAARSHIEVILPTIEKALRDAFPSSQHRKNHPSSSRDSMLDDYWSRIDAVAVTYGPGLLGSLLIGTLTARTLAILKQKPLYRIHHVEAHTYANFVTKDSRNVPADRLWPMPSVAPNFPLLSLTVSGGHTQLILFKDHGEYELLGQTQDDAVGEAFDKVARMLGLEYPGGPSISKAAEQGSADKYIFPESKLSNPYDFSFSGLKTAVLRHLQKLVGEDYSFPSHQLSRKLTNKQVADTAASFQRAAVQTMVKKTVAAYEQFLPNSVVIAGGVAANSELRRLLAEALPTGIEYAPAILCTDNAAMIASRGYWEHRIADAINPYGLDTKPSLSM